MWVPASDAGIVGLDPGIADRTDGDRQGEALEQRELDMDVEPLRLETGEARSDGLETLAHASRWFNPVCGSGRVPKIAAILSAVSRHRPSSQLRLNSCESGS
jgi:hypothetical protein